MLRFRGFSGTVYIPFVSYFSMSSKKKKNKGGFVQSSGLKNKKKDFCNKLKGFKNQQW